MGRRQQGADWAVRGKLRSPGHPKFQRHVEVEFWRAIAQGLVSWEASAVAGVAQAVRGALVPRGWWHATIRRGFWRIGPLLAVC